jgi:glyoxylase-like metal-dependent hydrolase (beta-lactamase superfamily II)
MAKGGLIPGIRRVAFTIIRSRGGASRLTSCAGMSKDEIPVNIVNVGYDSTNYYVIGLSSARLFIDVGWPGTLPKLLANLKRKDIPLQDVHYILITHYHPDHAGIPQEVKKGMMPFDCIRH